MENFTDTDDKNPQEAQFVQAQQKYKAKLKILKYIFGIIHRITRGFLFKDRLKDIKNQLTLLNDLETTKDGVLNAKTAKSQALQFVKKQNEVINKIPAIAALPGSLLVRKKRNYLQLKKLKKLAHKKK